MSEIEQAIKEITVLISCFSAVDTKRRLNLALSALREKQERDNPKPLTLEQLRERNGKPVWITNKKARKNKPYWSILNGKTCTLQGFNKYEFTSPRCLFLFSMDYGTVWLAYDHQPKEEKA